MSFHPFPASACWQHRGARSGFEVAYFTAQESGWRIDGTTAALEDGQTWVVSYSIEVDAAWVTRSARITGRTAAGLREVLLESDGAGHWVIDGEPAADLDGCLDVDLESSALTNTLPVHRLDLRPGGRAEAPAAYVRALTLTAGRLDQSYAKIPGEAEPPRYDYAAPAFGFTARLVYDASGLVADYPGIARRAG
jgi:uncharacterized protein